MPPGCCLAGAERGSAFLAPHCCKFLEAIRASRGRAAARRRLSTARQAGAVAAPQTRTVPLLRYQQRDLSAPRRRDANSTKYPERDWGPGSTSRVAVQKGVSSAPAAVVGLLRPAELRGSRVHLNRRFAHLAAAGGTSPSRLPHRGGRVAPRPDGAHLAARKAHKEVVKLLLDKGACAALGNADYETVKIMVDGAPREDAARRRIYSPPRGGLDGQVRHREITRRPPGARSQGTVHMAVYYGHYDCVRLRLRWGAKVNVRMSGGATPLFLAVEKGPAAVARLILRWGADPEIPREDGETVFTAHFESLVDARALLAENYLSAGAPFDYDPDDAERLEREQAPFRPFPPLWVRFLRVVAAALLVVLIQADWTQRKLRDYFLRPLARITNPHVTTRLPDLRDCNEQAHTSRRSS